jgi:glutaminyl-peptide cyclotransferase
MSRISDRRELRQDGFFAPSPKVAISSSSSPTRELGQSPGRENQLENQTRLFNNKAMKPNRNSKRGSPIMDNSRNGTGSASLVRWVIGKILIATAVFVVVGGGGMGLWLYFQDGNRNADAAVSTLKLEDIPFDGAQAYEYLKELCAIGPRRSNSLGMQAQQKMLIEHFKKCGGQVTLQRFRARHPQDGSWVPMTNILVSWNPKVTDRTLLCAHYDTLPYPLMDRQNPQGRFVGANDSASGVAILMEMGRHMKELKGKRGIDFLFLDGEEFIYDRRDQFFLGSEYFAREYAKGKPRYRAAVLLDMVGDADLQILQDRSSLEWTDTRPIVKEIWSIAARLGVREFVSRPMPETDFLDDHVMLHELGGIPCIDLIDFDYPPWHTEGDTPDKCSPLSLAKVGWVIEEWLKSK